MLGVTFYLAFTFSLTAVITLSSCTIELSPSNDKDAELTTEQAISIWHLNKILPDLLKLRTKAERPDIQFSQHTSGPKAQSGSKLYS